MVLPIGGRHDHEEFLDSTFERMSSPMMDACDRGQGYLEELGHVLKRGRDFERPRAMSLLVSIGDTVDELGRFAGQFGQIGLYQLAELANECRTHLDQEYREGLRLAGFTVQQVDKVRIILRDRGRFVFE
jgi:hypothetical protein